MTATIEEDFELELRSIPGVVNVGVRHGDSGEVNAVTVLVRGHKPESIRSSATQVTSLYYPDVPVILEEARALTSARLPEPPRVALKKVDFDAHNGETNVQLAFGDRTGTGLAGSGPLIGGVEATLGALRDLDFAIPYYLMTVTEIDTPPGISVVVALRSHADGADRLGIAGWGADRVTTAARATLDALNRYVSIDPDRTRSSSRADSLVEQED